MRRLIECMIGSSESFMEDVYPLQITLPGLSHSLPRTLIWQKWQCKMQQGGWPPEIEKLMFETSIREGYSSSRLPKFTRAEKVFVRGTADFFGLNYYTGRTVRKAEPGEEVGPWFSSGYKEINAIMEVPNDAYSSSSPVIPVYSKGLRSLLCWIKKAYGNVQILITENGFPGSNSGLNDYDRIKFMKEHLEQFGNTRRRCQCDRLYILNKIRPLPSRLQ
ncbi:unnamed protein product [Leptidea sinapis]|uniref:Uncharacterized protein n=1 Tax=Leptidea sinapis TaxID=189913 RepID=A0A5E4PMJ4_9NEOP|nr:unnamed protein product [Leptidea sinapis]